jgi:hypothetical protein
MKNVEKWKEKVKGEFISVKNGESGKSVCETGDQVSVWNGQSGKKCQVTIFLYESTRLK